MNRYFLSGLLAVSLFPNALWSCDREPQHPPVSPQSIPEPAPPPTASASAASSVSKSRFISSYTECKDGVCTLVDVGGATRLGDVYPARLCPDVRNLGRPFHPVPVPAIDASAMRPEAAKFAPELAWVTDQVRSSACTCCHDSALDGHAAMWDIAAKGPWVDQFSNRGLAIMAGRIDSPIFGTKAGIDGNGFSRAKTGAPTTDPDRMRAFFDGELERRGVTEADIARYQQEEDRRFGK